MNFLEFAGRAEAAAAAAETIADAINSGLEDKARCSIVVSGGSTPGPCFDRLSRMPLEWNRVTVVPSDERWVPADHPDSNERLIRESLLVNKARDGVFLPLFRQGLEPEAAVLAIGQDLSRAIPFACALLGMGEDGHFASLFPDFTGLEEALSPDCHEHCLVVRTASSPHVRISLSLAALLTAKSTILLIFGEQKRRVLEAAASGDATYPITRLLRQSTRLPTVVWAP